MPRESVLRPVTPSALSFRDCTCGSVEAMTEIVRCTWPLRRSVTAGPVPLYGTCTILMPPASMLKYSVARWLAAPLPPEA